MSIVATYTKPSGAVLDFSIDWSTYLGSDTISSSSWSVPGGITTVSNSNTTTAATIYLSGGTAGQTYKLTNTIVTAGGRTDSRDIVIIVESTRVGMTTLIEELRSMANVGTADYSVAGFGYWTDDQLQRELDKTQQAWRTQMLNALPTQVSGSVIYQDYRFPDWLGPWIEDPTGGTAVWRVMDGTGNTIGSANYSVNVQARRIIFNSNQLGSVTYLDCYEYDLNKAAASIWRWKAANVAGRVDWASDNHNIKASQARQAALEMARYYSGLAGVQTSYLVRTDEN